MNIYPFSQQSSKLRSFKQIQIRRRHNLELFTRFPIQKLHTFTRVLDLQGVDERRTQSTGECTWKTLCEPILRPEDGKAPVARPLIEIMFSFEDRAFDAQYLESLSYEQSYGTCSDDQDMEVRIVVTRHHLSLFSLCDSDGDDKGMQR